MDNAEEQAHYEALRDTKMRRLHTLELQIERQGGDAHAASHLLVERTELRAALAIVEPVVTTAVPASLGDELGGAGRWLATMEQHRQTSKAVRDLAGTVIAIEVRLDEFMATSQDWRNMHRQLIVIIGITVVLTLLFVAILATYLAARGT